MFAWLVWMACGASSGPPMARPCEESRPRQHSQIHVQPDPRCTPHPQPEHGPLVLEPAELALSRPVTSATWVS